MLNIKCKFFFFEFFCFVVSMQKSIAENEERQRVELKERLAREEAERIAADAEKQRRM